MYWWNKFHLKEQEQASEIIVFCGGREKKVLNLRVCLLLYLLTHLGQIT